MVYGDIIILKNRLYNTILDYIFMISVGCDDMKYSGLTLNCAFSVTCVLSFYRHKFDKNYKYKGERHNFWEMVYVKSGTIGVTAGNKCYEIGRGTAIFHKPGEFHSLWSAGGTTPEVFIITFLCEDNFMKFFEDKIVVISDDLKTVISEVENSFGKIISRCCDDGVLHRVIPKSDVSIYDIQAAKNLLEYFLIRLSHKESQRTDVIKRLGTDSSADIYRQAVDYLNSNICEKITISDVCRYIGVGATTLKGVFSKYTGSSIMKFFTQLKINRAKALLESGMSVGKVSETLGFSSQNYFCFAFKRETGTTPFSYKESVFSAER